MISITELFQNHNTLDYLKNTFQNANNVVKSTLRPGQTISHIPLDRPPVDLKPSNEINNRPKV